ncbi:MAG: tRNA (adenosine(37)-N6)-threonylcarbamoyltransferase complex dimerization subunit type 1 TsaB [Bacteroidia bacterium]|nr:tRNA (adenosine(37)-N6)-threonylcarbamoyltransferase complex dimerization subunit type 1 TsaB [Bacteroidia bacterium]MDW8158292.1 tRNA (adenosine(37)-N6)-threonylcarbamoyltransferase complex dimerization subunit type 1 TsaB [Bacteroidia bacterium]
MLLLIETSTDICSLAIAKIEGNVIASWELEDPKSHSEYLTLIIESLLKTLAIEKSAIKAIAVSIGPGSYTGLRIGVSVAKGLAYATSCPLIGIPTLVALAQGGVQLIPHLRTEEWVFIPMLDARRNEVYYAVLDFEGNLLQPFAAQVVDEMFLRMLPTEKKWCFLGNGSTKVFPLLLERGLCISNYFVLPLTCSARYMAKLAADSYQRGIFENIYTLEPLYLKSFGTTTPKPRL